MTGSDDVMQAFIRFRAASREFLAAPSELPLRALLAAYTVWHVVSQDNEAGLDEELGRIEINARNILIGLP